MSGRAGQPAWLGSDAPRCPGLGHGMEMWWLGVEGMKRPAGPLAPRWGCAAPCSSPPASAWRMSSVCRAGGWEEAVSFSPPEPLPVGLCPTTIGVLQDRPKPLELFCGSRLPAEALSIEQVVTFRGTPAQALYVPHPFHSPVSVMPLCLSFSICPLGPGLLFDTPEGEKHGLLGCLTPREGPRGERIAHHPFCPPLRHRFETREP